MKKKIVVMLSLVLCLMLSISLAACSKNKHEAKSEWKFDNAQHWHECATKGHDDKLDVADHSWDDGEITTPPTETAEGVKTYTCTVCKTTKTESEPKLTHTHTFDMNAWETSDTHHWHKATCAHTNEKDGYEEHKGAWTTKTEADYGVNKVEERTCTVCKKHQERTVENSALVAKDNTITLNSGVAKVKTYDGQAIALTASDFTTNGNGAITFAYRVKDSDGEFSADAPKNAGVYEVKVSVAATTEWKACDTTVEYTINKKVLVFETNNLTKTYDGTATYTHNFTVEEGLVAGDTCSYSFDVLERIGSASYEICINAGTYEGVISQNEVCNNDNYTVSNQTGLDDGQGTSLTVNKATISGLKFSIKIDEIDDEEGGETSIKRDIVVNGEKIEFNIIFSQKELCDEEGLELSIDGKGGATCKIEFVTPNPNYVFGDNIGSLDLDRT